jgi:hypothetical protein
MKFKRGIAFNNDGQTDDHLMQVKLTQEWPQIWLVVERPKARHNERARSPRNRHGRKVTVEPMLQSSTKGGTGVLALSHRHRLTEAEQARAELVCVIL